MQIHYPLPTLNTLPADIQEKILAVQEKAGFVPNVFLMLARRPDELRAFFAYHDALMLRKGGLSKGEKEMIVVATSGFNNCLYCVVAHGAILRIYEKSPQLADQIAINHNKANLSPRQHAMLDYALKVAANSSAVNQTDFDTLTAHGFDVEDIWDIGNITALFALSNRMANVTGLMPNTEFYTMGRSAK
jgi:uncharacterized peroxidase-related enzyme